MVDVRPAGDGTGADGNDNLRRRHRVIGLSQSEPHIVSHGPRDEQAIGVPWRGHELNAEAAQVENDGVEHVDIGLATIAAAGAYLPQLERTAEQAARLVVESLRQLESILADHQVLASAHGQAVVAGMRDGALRAGLGAIRTEQATTQV